MLQAIDLTRRFEDATALDQLNLTVAPGTVCALFGGNGAGKSTTINLFLGFIPPTSGQALVAGIDVAKDPDGARRQIAYLPENVMLYGHASARENLQYFAALGGRKVSRQEAHALLIQAGLPESACERQVRHVSKGMRQKCGIAIAFAKDAKALLMDEPFSGLDPSAAAELASAIARLKSDGRAILMSTHDLFRARALADAIGIMRRGKLVAYLQASELAGVDLEKLYLETMAAPEGVPG